MFKEVYLALGNVVLTECKKENASLEEIEALAKLAAVFLDYFEYSLTLK